MVLGDEITSGFRGKKENDLLKALNLSNFPWMPEYNDFDSNVNIDGDWYMPVDTISDSDVGFVAMGPLAIMMLVTLLQLLRMS